jgi:exo-1,4-beta-D-glucosaminidase
MPNGAFYGAKIACEPLHLVYNYGNNSVCIINDTFNIIDNYKAEIEVYDIHSKSIYTNSVDVNTNSESQKVLLTIPEINELTNTYFLSLKLSNEEGNEIDSNFYWLSRKSDILDYDAEFESWAYYTPSKEYADFKLLNKLPEAELDVDFHIKNGEINQKVEVVIKNMNDTIAFFIELQLIDKTTGEVVLPVLWGDNYLSLLPQEKRKINAKILYDNYQIENLGIRVKGWNTVDFYG